MYMCVCLEACVSVDACISMFVSTFIRLHLSLRPLLACMNEWCHGGFASLCLRPRACVVGPAVCIGLRTSMPVRLPASVACLPVCGSLPAKRSMAGVAVCLANKPGRSYGDPSPLMERERGRGRGSERRRREGKRRGTEGEEG